jgi:hypothetical protein
LTHYQEEEGVVVYTPFHLLKVLRAYAPNEAARLQCDELLDTVRRDLGENTAEVDKVLAGALLDGLRHGNWPWTFPVRVPVPADEASVAAAYDAEFRGVSDD